MLARIQKQGNSQGPRLAKNILVDAHLDAGDEVDIIVIKNSVRVKKPTKKIRKQHNLKDLIARIPVTY